MGAIFAGSTDNLLQYGSGIALPIAALGVFVGLRTWSSKISRETGAFEAGWEAPSAGKPVAQEGSGNRKI